MEKKSEGKTRKCLTLLGGRTSLLLCLSLMFQSSYAAGDSTVPEMGNMCRITAHWYFPSSASNPKKFVIPGKKH